MTSPKERRQRIAEIERYLTIYHNAKIKWLKSDASDEDVAAVFGVTREIVRHMSGEATDLPENDPRRDALNESLATIEAEGTKAEQRFRRWARDRAQARRGGA